MAYFPQFPAIYAYHPVPIPSQDYYALYPGGPEGAIFYDSGPLNHHHHHHHKVFKGGRKESTDSGISVVSRKTSNTSTISNQSTSSVIPEEPSKENNESDASEDEPPYVEPDDELCEKIVQQVEFYFSDANITKDKFLLKHVKRNKEGFVSLKLISSFKRVKHLSKDWRQVASAIERKSAKLEVNDLKTKVRRLDELPEYDETTPSRTVVALNLQMERPTIEGVAEVFGKVGDIVLIRILRPGNPVPADIKPFVNKHPEMTAKVCALVEFERTEFALKAVRELNDETSEEKMKVIELVAPPAKKNPSNKKQHSEKNKENQMINGGAVVVLHHPHRRSSYAGNHQYQQQNAAGRARRISLYHNMKFEDVQATAKGGGGVGGLNPNAPTFQMHRRISRPSYVHPIELMQLQQNHQQQSQPGWVSRRLLSECSASGLALPPNVIRFPRGPARGSKGFNNWCKSRMATQKKSHAVPIVNPQEVKEEEVKEENKDEIESPELAQAVNLHPPVIVINDDDSGNEDEGFSDPDPTVNERTR